MSAVSTVNLNVNKTNLQSGGAINVPITPIVSQTAPEAGPTSQAFSANTFASVSIPTGATGVLITIPSTNAGLVTLKSGTTGDVGIPLVTTAGTNFWLPLTSTATLGLLCVSAITVTFLWT